MLRSKSAIVVAIGQCKEVLADWCAQTAPQATLAHMHDLHSASSKISDHCMADPVSRACAGGGCASFA